MLSLKTTIITVFLAAAAAARDITELPECAQICYHDSMHATDCEPEGDFACLCASDPYINKVTSCVIKACSLPEA